MEERVYIYLRLRTGEATLARSKIREFGALGGMLAAFLREVALSGLPTLDAPPHLEFVDANTEVVLIRFRPDPARGEQVIEGTIPRAYRARLLGSGALLSVSRFAEHALPDEASEAERAELQGRLAQGGELDVVGLIRRALKAGTGDRFEVHLPMR